MSIKALWRSWFVRQSNLSEPGLSFVADIPIRTASEDLLGRSSFAAALAKVLYRHRSGESLVVALCGGWGDGKTSIKNLIVEQLKSQPSGAMKVVEFNPWQWGADEAITRAFFREISVALGDVDQSLVGRRRAFEFRRYADILQQFSKSAHATSERAVGWLTWLINIGLVIGGAGVIALDLPAKLLAATLLMLSGTLMLASKIIGWLGRDREDSRPLDFARARLEDRLKTLPRNILVVIDDVDRLEPEQIRLVLRHVKANANLPGLTYLLLYQRDIVERCFDKDGLGDGRRYIEKIVQAVFDIPAVEAARVARIALSELERISNEHSVGQLDQVRWGNMWVGALRHLLRNVRGVRRFIGGIELQFDLQSGLRVFETNLVDTIGLEALRIFEPEVFENIARNKSVFTGTRDRASSEKERVQTLVSVATKQNKEIVLVLLKQMFPIVSWAHGGSWYGSGWEEKWAQERRICSERYFDRYFALRIPDGQISDSEFLDFLDHIGDRTYLDKAFADLDERGLLTELLDRLDEIKTKLPLKNADTFLPALFDLAERFEDRMGFSRQMPFISAWCTASWYLKGEPSAEERARIFLNAMRAARGLAVSATLIGLDVDRRRKGDVSELMFADEQFEELKAAWIKKLMDALDENPAKILRSPHFVNFLYRWKEFSDEEGPRVEVGKLIEQPTLLLKLLAAFLVEVESHSAGDYVTRKKLSLRLDNLRPFVDISAMVAKVEALPVSSDQREEQARSEFLDAAAAEAERAT